MSHYLLLYNHNVEDMFSQDAVRTALEGIPGVHDLREGNNVGAPLQAEFEYADDRTTISLSEDLCSLMLTGGGEAALALAIAINDKLQRPLCAYDPAYANHVPLDPSDGIEELKSKIIESAET